MGVMLHGLIAVQDMSMHSKQHASEINEKVSREGYCSALWRWQLLQVVVHRLLLLTLQGDGHNHSW